MKNTNFFGEDENQSVLQKIDHQVKNPDIPLNEQFLEIYKEIFLRQHAWYNTAC